MNNLAFVLSAILLVYVLAGIEIEFIDPPTPEEQVKQCGLALRGVSHEFLEVRKTALQLHEDFNCLECYLDEHNVICGGSK